ncbi:MAG: hypothetical protein Ta2D_01170 [Rickettsiales bacterium]|nr:MAG: hypothetical protein Ta2D_01170 [Rickettsiales bacterium]
MKIIYVLLIFLQISVVNASDCDTWLKYPPNYQDKNTAYILGISYNKNKDIAKNIAKDDAKEKLIELLGSESKINFLEFKITSTDDLNDRYCILYKYPIYLIKQAKIKPVKKKDEYSIKDIDLNNSCIDKNVAKNDRKYWNKVNCVIDNIEGVGIVYRMVKINNEGQFDGKVITYKSNKTKLDELFYKNGMRNGKFIVYYENGKIKGEGFYKDGKMEGELIMYYENGKIKGEGFFKDGKMEGKFISYYENEKIKKEGFFKDGKMEGKFISYYENGNIESVSHYKNDKLNGEFIQYTKNGIIEGKEYFIVGERIKL